MYESASETSNALKYTPRGGVITLDAASSGGSPDGGTPIVAISVNDTGPDVPPVYRARIFDKAFRLEHQQLYDGRRSPQGAGIGLYMCRQIVELHGGQVFCTAGPNEHGACITVQIPVGDPTTAAGNEAPLSVQGGR